ncbi:MAG TPA: tRNA (adenosine(37)-N6)-threonylcarbamoyltransferase complex ATPase subunit type 1 TsaE [Actinobacteria bacterium]|nr:tRNA (adenosine(37)-N6)-threonylcarbamoyltransferase complex ATPase subunit type 1 TsaE [Actinomycetota bacterium]
MTIDVRTGSPEETLDLGRRLAPSLTAGDVVLLSGRLGAGKTLFVAGIAEGLGIDEPIVSPTFVIARVYRGGFLPLVHADVYRLQTAAEFDDLELVDLAADGVLVVEWGEAVESVVPDDHLLVRIEVVDDGERRIAFEPRGSWSRRHLGVAS